MLRRSPDGEARPPRWTEYLSLSDVAGRFHPDNPKAHAEEKIAESIGRFGVIEHIVLDDRTGLLISGHGRVESFVKAREAGGDVPEGVVVDEAGDWLVPVNRGWASADDIEAKAALVGLNETTIKGGWVPDALVHLLSELAEQERGLIGTAFDPAELDLLISELADPSMMGVDPSAEWEGMPEFRSEDLMAKYAVAINFPTEEDQQAFFKLIDRPVSRRMWWPRDDGHVGSAEGEKYVVDDGSQGDG